MCFMRLLLLPGKASVDCVLDLLWPFAYRVHRQTVGRITGDIVVNGHAKEQATWARVCGYGAAFILSRAVASSEA